MEGEHGGGTDQCHTSSTIITLPHLGFLLLHYNTHEFAALITTWVVPWEVLSLADLSSPWEEGPLGIPWEGVVVVP